MSGLLRSVTVANAILYFGASLFHSGAITRGPFDAATIPEAILGLILVAGALGLVRSARLTYAIVIAVTLLGLGIVIATGAPSVDLWIHIAMFTGLGMGLALILRSRGNALA
jgi:hypothetical protein